MNYTSVSLPTWANEAHTQINCMVDFVGIGLLPFTADPNDSADHGRLIFDECLSGKYGPIADYVAPVFEPSVESAVLPIQPAANQPRTTGTVEL